MDVPQVLKRLGMVVLLLLVFGGVTDANADGYEVPGVIAYVGGDANVYTVDLQANVTYALTTDAANTRRYQWPTWSTDGRLAYFCCDANTNPQTETEIYVSSDGMTPGDSVYTAGNGWFTYAYWSPRDCSEGDGCRDLAVLLSLTDARAFALDLVRVSSAGTEGRRLDQRGAPFYLSWSPDGGRLLFQRDGTRINVYSLTDESLETFDSEPGLFPAPQWSPVDDRLLVGLLNESSLSTDIVIIANDETRVLQAGLAGDVAFNWSPDGNYVAYRTFSMNGASSLVVLDAETGEIAANSGREQAYAFFWSPDSQHIAFISVATPPGSFSNASYRDEPRLIDQLRQEDGLRWSVLDLEANTMRMYASFVPTAEMLYLLGYFNQFAQSHSLWSPDSTHIIFSEVLREQSSISILDTTRQDAVPFSVAEGVIGVWSDH